MKIVVYCDECNQEHISEIDPHMTNPNYELDSDRYDGAWQNCECPHCGAEISILILED